MMRSWIADRVEAYCDKKFNEASAVIDEEVVKAVVRCEDQLTSISLDSDVKFNKKIADLKIRLSEEIDEKENEMIQLIEEMDVNAELSKCFETYIEKNMVVLNPAIVMSAKEMKGYKKSYELHLIRMSSFKGEGTSAISGTTAAMEELAHKSADDRALAKAMDSARLAGGKIGAEIAYLYSTNYARGAWKEYHQDLTCSSASTATVSVHFYKIKGEKEVEDEDDTKDEDPYDSSLSTEESI
jgi:hypothetical protein